MINVGDKLPDFKLTDHKGNVVDSKSLAGKGIIFGFHPLAYTGVCEKQMKQLEENYDYFKNLGYEVFGVSIDTSFSKNSWAKQIDINNVKMLADFWPHGGFAIKLGIFRGNEGFSERACLIINKQGIVKWTKIYDIPELPSIDEIKEQAKKATL
ncbi:MAG: redoxin domain-containing protein [Candidatus Muirbacterium halophilum]|nr:redoxin domain-containing protein [Candidatus Muirbacterium halophilum]MCK9474831.1 redoxin domain-containing protein [Candidatus Muirbacterium halophilum]